MAKKIAKTDAAVMNSLYAAELTKAGVKTAAVFFHGVRFPTEASWKEVAPHLDPPMRRCLAVGQCVGRARRLQAVRMPRSRISGYSEVAGWELGE